ncbi:Hypothetical predicted protein [Paramuricea clavata]|uniref:Pre-mRNA 3'-end-processing endonuclease polyadenylation factor C-term domain-containing protein n=1 Tax=Paramuricea clavata TaxID=317549 RepID=A0A6S7GP33_PARCT|nr:Hypothetical predicted protein [Paramuricea clavata]
MGSLASEMLSHGKKLSGLLIKHGFNNYHLIAPGDLPTNAVNDMYADGVLTVILRVDSNPAAVLNFSNKLQERENWRFLTKVISISKTNLQQINQYNNGDNVDDDDGIEIDILH